MSATAHVHGSFGAEIMIRCSNVSSSAPFGPWDDATEETQARPREVARLVLTLRRLISVGCSLSFHFPHVINHLALHHEL